jgi:hypothetical protein
VKSVLTFPHTLHHRLTDSKSPGDATRPSPSLKLTLSVIDHPANIKKYLMILCHGGSGYDIAGMLPEGYQPKTDLRHP